MTSTLSAAMPLDPVRSAGLGQFAPLPAGLPAGTALPDAGRSRHPQPGEAPSSVTPARSATAGLRAVRPLPSDAPAGAEPAIWALLEPAELAFFGVAPDATALTYARGSLTNATAAPARGLTLDVRA